jgi:hypothetical protein
VGVTVARKEFSGPITLTIADPPPGITVRAGTIATGQTVGSLSISASPNAGFAAVPLKLVGRAQGPNGLIEAEAIKYLIFAQQEKLTTNALTQKGLVAAPVLPTPVTLDAPAGPIEVAHGFGSSIPIKVVRSKGADAVLTIAPLPLPPGLAVPAASIPEKAASGTITVSTAVEAPLGTMTIALQAKGKFEGREQTISIPAVSLNLVPPAEVTLAATAVEVKPGATVEVKGKVQRKGVFKEPVTIKINGLPRRV